MKNYVKKIDRFSVSPKLYIRKKDSFQTVYGGFMTLIVLGLIIIASLNFSKNFIYKKSPNIVTSQKSYEEIPQFSLGKFHIGFFLNPLSIGKISDPTIFEVSGGYLKFNLSNEGNQSFVYKSIDMEKCTFNRFESMRESPIIKRLRMDLNYCFSENQAKNLIIEGGWGQSRFDMIYVDFKMCLNTTENGNHCKPQEYIDQIIKSAALGVDIIDSLIDLNDYNYPIKPQIFTPYTLGSPKLSKELHVYIKSGLIKTDKGWLIEEYEDNFFLKVDREREFDRDIADSGISGQFARIYFRMSNTYEIYERKYDKLQNVVANIGAIANLLIKIVGILLVPFISLEYKKALSNKVFDFDLPEDENKFFKRENLNAGKKTQNNNGENLFGESKTTTKLHFNIFEKIIILFEFLRGKNRKIQLLNKSYDKIISKLDIFFILRKLYELEKLKFLLLNEDQNRLLKYLPKPLLTDKTITKRNPDIELCKLEKNNSGNLLTIWGELVEQDDEKSLSKQKGTEAFLNTLKKSSKDFIDVKLISFLTAKKIFELKPGVSEKDSLSASDCVYDEDHISKVNGTDIKYQNKENH